MWSFAGMEMSHFTNTTIKMKKDEVPAAGTNTTTPWNNLWAEGSPVYAPHSHLAQELGEVLIVHLDPAWCRRLEADLFAVSGCEDQMSIIWEHARPGGVKAPLPSLDRVQAETSQTLSGIPFPAQQAAMLAFMFKAQLTGDWWGSSRRLAAACPSALPGAPAEGQWARRAAMKDAVSRP